MAKSSVNNFIQPGMRFERWTVLERFEIAPNGKKQWLCRCTCGTERYVSERGLRYGESKSCGCLRADNARKATALDLTGMTFGDLKVLGRSDRKRNSGGIWWRCVCSCGADYEVPGTVLATGKRTSCGGSAHERQHRNIDIHGKRFHQLVAQYPTQQRDNKGSVVWHCRCDCGNELDVSYNTLVYGNIKSCGCQRREHEQNLRNFLTYVDGTSVDAIRSKKVPSDNTTGYKGVYLIRGKYVAKIVFQKKQYFLGSYDRIQDAVSARAEAEDKLFNALSAYYSKWQKIAREDPDWAQIHPIRIEVRKDTENGLSVQFEPEIA